MRSRISLKAPNHKKAEAGHELETRARPVERLALAGVGSFPVNGTISQAGTMGRMSWASGISLFGLTLALVLWWLSLPAIDPEGITDLGLVSVLPWTFYASLAVLSAALALILTHEDCRGPLPFLHLGAFVVVLHGTPAIVYGTLRYAWAWKHLGIVDFIQRHGTVDLAADTLSAYHNWPMLFFATAWIADALGLNSLEISYGLRFTPVILNLGFLAALVLLLRLLTDDRRLIVGGACIFLLANWIGQDYFSPQGVTFLLHLVLLALFLGPLRRQADGSNEPAYRLLSPVRFLEGLSTGMPVRHYGPMQRALSSALALVLILTIVATHQLTPLAVILAAAALTAVGKLSPGYLIFAVTAELTWLLYIAAPFVAGELRYELANFGNFSETAGQIANVANVSADRAWVVLGGRALSGAVGLLAIIGGLRRLSKGIRDVPAVALTLAPLPLAAVAYGGEAFFRTYLFLLPFLAFFAACCFFPTPDKGRSALVRSLFACFAFLAAIGFLLANNGKDREYRFAPDEVAVATWLYSTAPAGSLLIEGARNYPQQFLNYENFTYVPIAEEGEEERSDILADPATVLARWMSDGNYADAYFFVTRSQKAYLDAHGLLPDGAMDEIEERLLASPRFFLAKASPNAKVFKLVSRN